MKHNLVDKSKLTYYCILIRFRGKEHLVWLEPESLNSSVIYPGGLSCTMPAEMQERMIHAIPGLENAVILRPGLSPTRKKAFKLN